MAPRLQGEASPAGWLDLSIWGSGRVGTLAFDGLGGPYAYAANRVVSPSGGLYVAQSQPVLLLEGTGGFRFSLGAPGAMPGVLRVEPRPGGIVVALGEDEAEAEAALRLSPAEIKAEAAAHVARCDLATGAEPLMRSLVLQGAHAALSAVRRDRQGRFAGLAAGLAYSAPARCYYRDSYWTLPMLRRLDPEAARATVGMLAEGVRDDGEAPSAVLAAGAKVTDPPREWREGEWWSDHFDSPLYFVLMLDDEPELAREWWPKARVVMARYEALCPEGTALPIKPRHDRDWADNVFRSGRVAYDLGLWVGALDVIARLGADHDPVRAEHARLLAAQARSEIAALWRPEGWPPDYDGESHLALDALTLLRFDAVGPQQAGQFLAATKKLERSWGVACCHPPYARRKDLRDKSANAGRYHNGGGWPWLDGLLARERRRRGGLDWRHPLTRWWRTALDEGWAGAVEHHSPAYGRGSLLQAWSSLPAAVALELAL